MPTLQEVHSFVSVWGALLLLSEARFVARTPTLDAGHAITALLVWMVLRPQRKRGWLITTLTSCVTFYIGVVSFTTGYDVRPATANASWSCFGVLAMIVAPASLLGCLCCSRAESADPNRTSASPDRCIRTWKVSKGIAVCLMFAGLHSQGAAGLLPSSSSVWYRLREGLHALTSEGSPAASSLRGQFEPLSWEQAEAKADETLALMTPQEKQSLMSGVGWPTNVVAGMEPEYGWYTGNTPPIPRLGVPALNMQDAANGYRPFHDVKPGTTTSWPTLLSMAATWDPALVEEVAAAIAREFRGKGANVLLGPSIQVHRTIWGGRNFEYVSGDDPYLGSALARAYVRGVQGEGVMAVAKHWAFNEQETNRFEYDAQVDARTAWELYYPPFEAAVDAGVCAVMCAYNRVNGAHSCNSPDLLKQDLRARMGFRGFVQSDWGATYAYSRSPLSGLDQDMPGNDGLFTEEVLAGMPRAVNDAARRVLAAIYRMRLEERPSCTPPGCLSERTSNQRTAAHRSLAAEMVTKSVVLLKNDGVLPFGTGVKTIAVAGVGADANCFDYMGSLLYTGGGSGNVIPGSCVTPLQGIRERAEKAGVAVVPSSSMVDPDAAIRAAFQADVMVVISGAGSTEFVDRDTFDGGNPNLPLAWDTERLINAVSPYKPTVVLMQTPGVVMMPWIGKVSAVANLFLAGEETGTGWARILFGDASPEGKLPIQFPTTIHDADVIRNNLSLTFSYAEGLFTSYRNPKATPVFAFGHGLSYTNFTYGPPSLAEAAACAALLCASLPVTNVGSRSGAEVVQAYLEFPAAPSTPSRILRGFSKTRVLSPSEQVTVLFNFTARDLSIYDVVKSAWLQQAHVIAHFGASSSDLRQSLVLLPGDGGAAARGGEAPPTRGRSEGLGGGAGPEGEGARAGDPPPPSGAGGAGPAPAPREEGGSARAEL